MSPEKYDVIMMTKLTTQKRMKRSRQSTSVHPRFSKSVMSRPSRARWSAALVPTLLPHGLRCLRATEKPRRAALPDRRRKSANLALMFTARPSQRTYPLSTYSSAKGRFRRTMVNTSTRERSWPHAIALRRALDRRRRPNSSPEYRSSETSAPRPTVRRRPTSRAVASPPAARARARDDRVVALDAELVDVRVEVRAALRARAAARRRGGPR